MDTNPDETTAANSPGATVLSQYHFDLQVGARPAPLPPLDSFQSNVVDAVLADGGERGQSAAVILGNPGSGRTTVAISLLRAAYERGRSVRLLVPDRLRADLLQGAVEQFVTDRVRPVRTSVSVAYDLVAKHEVANGHQSPELLTGAQEDLLLAELLASNAVSWPQNLTTTIATQAFRTQLRNLIARAREVNLTGEELTALGNELDRPIWVGAGEMMQHWDATIAVGSADRPARLSSAQLEVRAAQLLRQADTSFDTQVVVVDDLQDMTAASLQMLVAMVERGVQVWATANPDIAVATYRGGEPHLHGQFAAITAAAVHNLGPTHRSALGIQRLVAAVTDSITGSGDMTRRRLGSALPGESTDNVHLRTYSSPAQEASAVAQEAARLLLSGYEPADIAVITRTQTDVERIKLAFMREGIETTTRARAVTYASDSVARPLLEVLVPVSVEIGTEAQRFEALAGSALFSLSQLQMRRVVDAVVKWCAQREEVLLPVGVAVAQVLLRELAPSSADAEPGSGDAVDLKSHLEELGLVETAVRMRAIGQYLKLGEELRGSRPEEALWRLWRLTGVEAKWTERALSRGIAGAVDDERLDTVISLLRSADIWQQRNPGGSAEQFAAELLAQTLPTDTLAVASKRPAGVHILTAAQAVGRQWKAVFVVGINEDSWPRRSSYGGLAQAQDVTDLATGRTSKDLLLNGRYSHSSARQASRDDEFRMFAAAISRACDYLHLSAVFNDTAAPSQLLLMLAPLAGTQTDEDGLIPLAQVPVGTRPSALMAQLRKAAALAHLRCEDTEAWEEMLAILARLGYQKAKPERWSFFRPSQTAGSEGSADSQGTGSGSAGAQGTGSGSAGAQGTGSGSAATQAAGAPQGAGSDRNEAARAARTLGKPKVPYLSPSKIESILECPLRAFLSAHSGSSVPTQALEDGNLIHAIAEQYPQGSNAELMAQLEAGLAKLNIDAETEIGKRRIEMLRQHVACLAAVFDQDRFEEVLVEETVRLELPHAVLSGRVDRLEFSEDGVTIADIKTGDGGKYTGNRAKGDVQLAVYEYMLGFPNGQYPAMDPETEQVTVYPVLGARWIATQRDSGKQPASTSIWDNPDRVAKVEELIARAADLYRGPNYFATPGSHCRNCEFKSACPAQEEGEQVLP